jgi:uncharacterized RDD family membrane protein YckC
MTDNKILDISSSDTNLRLADRSTRFANHFVDTLGIFFIVFLHVMVLDGLLGVIPKDGSPLLGIYFFVLYVLYHALFEHYWGKTPGKFLSKTHVATINGQQPTFFNILGRNFCRLIPLDNISFLISKRGWHDEFSKTFVVYDN